MMVGPLNGVRVVEITMFQQGPVAGMRLGDLGADVIKIEAKTGDPARGFMKIIGAMAGLSGLNYYFEHHNRNKKAMGGSEATHGLHFLIQIFRMVPGRPPLLFSPSTTNSSSSSLKYLSLPPFL